MRADKYNTRVRQALSEEYVKCSKRKQELDRQYVAAVTRLTNEKDTLPYSEYLRLEQEKEHIVKMLQREETELRVWDMARGICLNVADNIGGEV